MIKSKPYPVKLTKKVTIGDLELKAGTPLFIHLYEGESPDKFYLNIEHDISQSSFVGPAVVIGHVALKSFYQSIIWKGKE
jgi:hypothetical protein